MEETITLVLPTRWVVGLGLLAGLLLLSLVVGLALPRSGHVRPPLERVQKRLGMEELNAGVFLILAIFWTLLFALLFGGLFWLVWQVLWETVPRQADSESVWNFRFLLVQMTALTAVLGAVVTLPVTLNRLRLQREANRTSEESLFNEKITEAAADLHARRQKTMRGIDGSRDVWQDDIIRRNAAINRLEDLVKERMRAAVEDAAKREVLSRVSRLLSIYVRELSEDVTPVSEPTEDRSPENLRQWAQKLKPRSDIENAVRTLGRLRDHASNLDASVEIDLEGANLQGVRLNGLNFNHARFREARLQGAVLSDAQLQASDFIGARLSGAVLNRVRLQGAHLGWARMQGADFYDAQMEGTLLFDARMQGAVLLDACMQGAYLLGTRMDDDTVISGAKLQGAAFGSANSDTKAKLAPFWAEMFADGSVQVPDGLRPAHWVDERLTFEGFLDRWHSWMRSTGMEPKKLSWMRFADMYAEMFE